MNLRSSSSRQTIVGTCLEKCAAAVQEIGAGRWSFVLSNGTLVPAVAQADEDWLIVEAPVADWKRDDRSRPSAWTWLGLNARLEGVTKIARLPDDDSLRVRADIALDDDVDLVARLREACAGLVLASESIGEGGGHVSEHGGTREAAASTIDLASLCRDAGWTFAEREGGRVAVDLGIRGGPGQALIEQHADGAVRASVALASCDDVTPSSGDALGVFLLTACGIVRLARAAVQEEEAARVPRFEVRYAAPPVSAEIGHALSALSVACALFGREAQALRDDRVARTYLSMRGKRPEGRRSSRHSRRAATSAAATAVGD